MKKPIAKMSIAKKEVAKKVVKKVTTKEIPVEKPIVKKPIKAKPVIIIPTKENKVTTKIVKPLFIEEPIIEINYDWDIESVEINNITNVISQITYEFIGTLMDQKHIVSGTIVIPKITNTSNKVETSDYKILTKQEILDYIISKVSERHLETMKGLIIQNFNGSKIIDKTFWKS